MFKTLFASILFLIMLPMAQGQTQVVIDFVDTATEQQIKDFKTKHGISAEYSSEFSKTNEKYQITPDLDIARFSYFLTISDPIVEQIEPNYVYTLPWQQDVPAIFENNVTADFPNDPKYKFQWHMNNINMPQAWKKAAGDKVIVAVLDTGVAYENYVDKKRNMEFKQAEDLKNTCFVAGYDFVNNSTHANDDHAHGTHCAGTIAQSTNNGVGVTGVAYKACIMPVKVLSGSGSGSVAGIAEGIKFAADNKAKVISMSLGGPSPSGIMKDAIDYAHSKGVTIIAAAGNDGQRKVGYPAAYNHVIAVSATDLTNNITFYSNYGDDIDIAAPGGDTRRDDNKDGVPDGVVQNTIKTQKPMEEGYFPFMGTSMATPHVAGVAALIVGQGVTNPDKVEEVLYKSANKSFLNGQKWNEKYGNGLLDADKAVTMAKNLVEIGSLELTDQNSSTLLSEEFKTKAVDVVLFMFMLALTSFALPLFLFAFLYQTKYRRPLGYFAAANAALQGYLMVTTAGQTSDWQVILLFLIIWWGVTFIFNILITVACLYEPKKMISPR